MSCIHLNERFCSLYEAVCDVPPSKCKYYKHPLGLYLEMDWSTIKESEVEDMSCIHSSWGGYCKLKQQFPEIPCSPHCRDYCTTQTAVELKKEINKGPATNVTCNCSYSNDDNDYITLLEKFINKCYPENNYGLFGMTPHQAETYVNNEMCYLGYNNEKITDVYMEVIRGRYSTRAVISLDLFVRHLLTQPHIEYELPVKELTIADIEKQLGYKIKIVGER